MKQTNPNRMTWVNGLRYSPLRPFGLSKIWTELPSLVSNLDDFSTSAIGVTADKQRRQGSKALAIRIHPVLYGKGTVYLALYVHLASRRRGMPRKRLRAVTILLMRILEKRVDKAQKGHCGNSEMMAALLAMTSVEIRESGP
jgi:hypothetical protein